MKNLTIYQQLQALMASTKQACSDILYACKKVAGRIRSCLSSAYKFNAGPVNEPTGAAALGTRSTTYPADWGDHPDANYRFRCERMRENLEGEIAEEELHRQALEILIK